MTSTTTTTVMLWRTVLGAWHMGHLAQVLLSSNGVGAMRCNLVCLPMWRGRDGEDNGTDGGKGGGGVGDGWGNEASYGCLGSSRSSSSSSSSDTGAMLVDGPEDWIGLLQDAVLLQKNVMVLSNFGTQNNISASASTCSRRTVDVYIELDTHDPKETDFQVQSTITRSLSLSIAVSLSLSVCLSLSISLSHSHTPSRFLSLSLPLSLFVSLSLSLCVCLSVCLSVSFLPPLSLVRAYVRACVRGVLGEWMGVVALCVF